jgi:hypothetical protein
MRKDPTEPGLVSDAPRESLGLVEVRQDLVELPERPERRPRREVQIDLALLPLGGVRKVREGCQRLAESHDRVAIERP